MRGFLASLDPRDRLLLAASLALAILLIVFVAVLAPSDNSDPTPSSYSAQSHGAKAAYLLLERSGYRVERWTRPLNDLAGQADEHTTLVLAEPDFINVSRAKGAVQQILQRGGRVLATGFTGGMVLPGNQVAPYPSNTAAPCVAEADGFGAIAGSGDVRLTPAATWMRTRPSHRVAYLCNGRPVVVAYPFGRGEAIWWADSGPLENAGILQVDNLSLLLHSIGPPATTRVVWDESLHGEGTQAGLWSYARGTPAPFLWLQLALVAALLLFSFSRRSGPLRPDPIASRATPIEFVQSLGALYHKAQAANTAVAIAYQRFRFRLEDHLGISHTAAAGTRQLAAAAAQRFGCDAVLLERDLSASEEAAHGAPVSEKRALALVQALRDHGERIHKHVPSSPNGGKRLGREPTGS